MNFISKIAEGKIIIFNFIGSLFKRKIPKRITEREKLEKQYLDNIKW